MTEYEVWKDKEPIGEHIVLELVKDDAKIIVPGEAMSSDRLKVLAVGPGKLSGNGVRTECQCMPGDIVLLNGAVGTFKLEKDADVSYGIVPEHRIAMIIDKSGRVAATPGLK